MCTTRCLNTRMVCKGILHAYLVQGWNSLTPQDLWTPQDPHLPPLTSSHHSLSHNPINTLPKNPSPITSISLPHHLFTTHIHPLFPINPTYLQKFKNIFPPSPTLFGRNFTLPSPYIYPSILLHFHTTQPSLSLLGRNTPPLFSIFSSSSSSILSSLARGRAIF